MIRRGSSALHQERPRGGSSRGGGLSLRLKAGEHALVRFYGPEEGDDAFPVLYEKHYVKRLPMGQQYITCAGEGCLTCQVSKRDRGVGLPSTTAVYWVKDYTLQHKLESPVRVCRPLPRGQAPKPTDYYETKYPPCATMFKRPCAYCQQGSASTPRGSMPFEISKMHAEGVDDVRAKARTFCRSCLSNVNGEGTLEVVAYSCPECAEPVDYYPENGPVVGCPSCHKHITPTEVTACSQCPDGAPCTLEDFLVKVTRHGDSKDTRYTFDLQLPPNPLEDAEREEILKYMPDWSTRYTAPTSGQVAALLGVVDTTHGQGGGQLPATAAPQPVKPHGTVAYTPARPAQATQAPTKAAAVPAKVNPFKKAQPAPEPYDQSDDDVPFLGRTDGLPTQGSSYVGLLRRGEHTEPPRAP